MNGCHISSPGEVQNCLLCASKIRINRLFLLSLSLCEHFREWPLKTVAQNINGYGLSKLLTKLAHWEYAAMKLAALPDGLYLQALP